MQKTFLLLFTAIAALMLSACNPISYFMLYQVSTEETPDDLADRRMTELEKARLERMRANPNMRESEIGEYKRLRGLDTPDTESIDTRPISTEELRERQLRYLKEKK